MSLTKEEAKEIIIDAIEKGTTHANYNRVNELAKLYLNLITGEGEALLRRFELRENEEAFQQRIQLTISTTDALTSSLMNPFEKVLRTEPLVKRIESKDEKAIDMLTDKLIAFFHSENQNSGLDYWFQTRFKSLSFTDPNAFVMLEWDAFDGNYEKASPYPYEVSSNQAINFSYVNNKLDFLLDKRANSYIEDNEAKSGFRYTLYGIGYVLVFEQVGTRYIPVTDEEIFESKKTNYRFAVRAYETKLNEIPMIRIGYLEDDATKGMTFVNPFHPAISYLKKIVKLISEADLSKTLHAFPQKFQYVQPCVGVTNDPCMSGVLRSGSVCGQCNGLGYVIHTSAQDAVILPLPKHKDDMYDLDELMTYKHPPIDLLEFQEKIIDKYEGKIHAAVFNTQAMVKKTTVATATERDQEMDSVYDTLHPFAEKITAAWSAIVSHISEISEINPKDLIIDLRYPNDFKLKSLTQLIADLKTANESNAPSFVRAKLNEDIAEQTFVDQPEEFNKYQVKQRFYPFPGKTSDEINMLMGLDYTPFRTKILYANFDILFKRAEKDHLGFWTLTFEKQESIIDGYLDELETELKPKQIEFNALA